jgi:Flp pilus assembly pilin Flp
MPERPKIRSLAGESGQTLVEYALIIGMVSIVCVTALGLLGTKISAIFSTLVTQF